MNSVNLQDKTLSVSGRDMASLSAGIKKTFDHTSKKAMDALPSMGIFMNGMDSLQSPITSPSITVPSQFLQEWRPGFIRIITSVRKIDEIVGMVTIGKFSTAEIVTATIETLGSPQTYGDYSNFPQASYNVSYESRTVYRGHNGIQVNIQEEETAAEIRIDSGAMKRQSAANQLEILRNNVGFFGYNNGANITYGLLNDPTLPAYVTVPNGVSGSPEWATKTYYEVITDIQTFANELRKQSQGNIDPLEDDICLVLPLSAIQALSVVGSNGLGVSVRKYISDTYKNMRIVGAPEFDGANGGASVAYLFAEKFLDDSTDGGQTFSQLVPVKFRTLGVERMTNGYREAYANATAGVYLSRPWAVYRASGV